ncbi:MAG: hypothetical protein QF430_01975 [Candidatus Marinimicrobia bacterium]|nr:hypothetical protein [Candidatus Neomarinimicrobiota bacterium]
MSKTLIYEPMTAVTDLMIAALALYIARELHAWHTIRLMNIHWHWGWAFYSLAVGAFMGAVSHGIGPHFSDASRQLIWKAAIVPVGFTSVFFLMGAFHNSFSFDAVRWLSWIPIVFLGAYVYTISKDDSFINAVKFYAPAMCLVLALMLYGHFGLDTAGSGTVALGILIMFIGAGVQVIGFGLHQHFNHNDIFHVIQMIGMATMYKGSQLITDYGVAP